MTNMPELFEDLVEKRKELDALREQSPEVAKALTLAHDYYALFYELERMCQNRGYTYYPTYVPPLLPNPYVPPFNPWAITWKTTSGSSSSAPILLDSPGV